VNQKTRLRMYMARHREKGITQLEAGDLLGIQRLSERIREMERDGDLIIRRTVRVPNRFRDTCYVTRYWLHARP